MAFGVTKWPGPCDPRFACFCILGYGFDGVPAFQYRASSIGALAPFTALLPPGILIPFNFLGSFNICHFDFVDGNDTYSLLIIPLGDPPYAAAPAPTLRWELNFDSNFGTFRQQGLEERRLPVPVSAPPPIQTVAVPPGPNKLPNPVLLVPAAWDAV